MVYAYIEAILALLLHTFTASLFVWLAYAKVLIPSLDLPYFSYREILFIVFAIKTLTSQVTLSFVSKEEEEEKEEE